MFNLTNEIYQDKDKAREHLEAIHWPDGPVCPHCGNCDQDRITKLSGKSTRPGVHKCKDDRKNPYERITHVGGFVTKQWKLTQQQAIAHIENGDWAFYVERPVGDRVWVEVAESRFGNKYLKTQPDGDEPNNLLSLPECP